MTLKYKMSKFRLLLWKNYKLQFRHAIRTSVEFFIPIFIILLVVITKRSTPALNRGPVDYVSFDIKPLADHDILGESVVYWSPCRNKQIAELAKSIFPAEEGRSKCFKTAKDLQVGCEAYAKSNIAAIDFGDDLIGKTCIGDKMTITIRLPAEIGSGFWHTEALFDNNRPPGPRHWLQNRGYDPDYYETGFLTLQYTISMAIIKQLQANTSNAELPEIVMRRYPYPTWQEDKLLTSLKNALGIIIALCLIVTVIGSVLAITIEKQKKLKVLMNVIGVSNTMQWLAWYIKSCTFVLIILTGIMLMLRFLSGYGNNIFQRSNLILVFLYLTLYACATTSFCFMISTFFKRAAVAAAVAAVLWYLSLAPYSFITDPNITTTVKLSCMLALNSAFSAGVKLILLFEERGEGWHWNDICKLDNVSDNLTMCHVNFMLLFDTVLYLVIGLYFEVVIPGIFSPSKSWRIFHWPYWFRQNEDLDDNETLKETTRATKNFEPDPTDLKPGIKIINLKKIFHKRHNAVDNLTLNVYNDQITILLGHNGCGKTTVTNMVCGILPPTDGTIVIDDYDISKDMKQVRLRLGWCSQQNILFNELTVKEHIMFFCRLKGLSKKEAIEEVDKYIAIMKLQSKTNEQASTLSGGMKRKLCAIIAICGKSKICILDEPSSGMDPASRRDLWDVLQSQKSGKTILMTTHYMDEANVLGDRFAIMADGKLQALGSSFFLKKKFSAGYKLIIVKAPNCNVHEVTKTLRGYIPTVEVESDVGNDLVYILPEENSPIFEGLLSNLESNSERLGIKSFNVTLTTMEDVFTKVGTSSYTASSDVPQNISQPPSSINLDEKYLTGFALKRSQIFAMFMKKFLCWSRSLVFFILPNLIMLTIMILIVIGQYMEEENYAPKELLLSNSLYTDFIAMVTTSNVKNEYYDTYKKIVDEENGTIVDWKNEDFGKNMLEHIQRNPTEGRFKNLFGATFSEKTITAWFNPEGYHVTPIALQYAINTILQTQLKCEDCGINFVNHPLPYTANTKSKIISADIAGLAFMLGFGMVFVTAFFIFFYVKERALKSKHLQFVSGVNITIYWGVALLWDFMCFLVTIFIVGLFLICLELDGYSTSEEIGRVVLLLLLFGLAALVQMYFMSFFFKVPALAYGQAVIINFFLGPFAVILFHVIFMETSRTNLTVDTFYTLFLIVPHFALTAGIYEIGKKYADVQLCDHIKTILESVNSTSSVCEMNSFCCDVDDAYLSWHGQGIGKHLAILAVFVFAIIIMIYLIEYRTFKLLSQYCQRHQTKRVRDSSQDDIDVAEERRKVKTGEINKRYYPLVFQDLTKYHHRILAVNRVCLSLQEHECFALLGTNGCGKTTTVQMIIGDLTISKGDVWVYGYNLNRHIRKVYNQVGYCPQFDALLGEMTGRETLIMFSLLRGLPYARSKDLAVIISEKYDFQPHLNKLVKMYSGGTKRKLSTAVAAIGNTSILLLDEPTTGMDPVTRRRIWNNLTELRERGKCIIITTHNMEECEAVATRLTIMANGRFKCLGSPQYLKNKYSQFYILTIKMRPTDVTAQSRREMDIVDSMIRTQFPGATLQETHAGIMIYYIPIGTVPWSKIFGDMERLKTTLNVEDYAVTQSSLEQVFLYLGRLQDR